MASSSLARVVQNPNFSWVTPYGNASVNYLGGNRGAGLRRRVADETGDRTREFQSARDEVVNPNLPGTGTANQVQGALNAAQNTQAGNLRSAARMVPNMTPTTVAAPRTPGATTTPVGDLTVNDGQIFHDTPRSSMAGVSGALVGDFGTSENAEGAPVNPTTGQPSAMAAADATARAAWAAEGGSSDAAMHRAQVRAGIRPAIDARTATGGDTVVRDGRGNITGYESHDGYGGALGGPSGTPGLDRFHSMNPAIPTSAGSAMWAQMSQRFNDSRAKLRAGLGEQQPSASTANVLPNPSAGGETYQWPAGQFEGIPDYNPNLTDSLADAENKDYY